VHVGPCEEGTGGAGPSEEVGESVHGKTIAHARSTITASAVLQAEVEFSA